MYLTNYSVNRKYRIINDSEFQETIIENPNTDGLVAIISFGPEHEKEVEKYRKEIL